MAELSPGYDDESLISKKRLVSIIDRVEEDLERVDQIFRSQPFGEPYLPQELEGEFRLMEESGREMDEECMLQVLEILEAYGHLKHHYDKRVFESLRQRVRELRLFLVG